MSNSINHLNNIRTLRAQTRELSSEVLNEILEKLTIVVVERRELEASRQENESLRFEKLETLRQMMLEDGIDPSELIAATVSLEKFKKTRDPRPPKYEYRDELGNKKTWTGQGRTPKQISVLISQGAKLADFEI